MIAGAGAAAYPEWSGLPRQLALALDAAVAAARAADAARFEPGIAVLHTLDREQVGMLLGALTRDLIERTYADGLDSDDVAELLDGCVATTAAWRPQVDRDDLIRAITGALGVSEVEDSPADPAAVLLHGVLLTAYLLEQADAALPPVLDVALRELMRAQTVEFP